MISCIQDVSLKGRPCKEDADCLFQHTCSEDGFCGGPIEGIIKDAGEPSKEPSKEPEAPDEPAKAEPVPEKVIEQPPVDEPPVGKRGLHLPCNWASDAKLAEKCARGLRCIRIDATIAVCLQDCSSDASLCNDNNDGRNACTHVAWNGDETVSVCTKEVSSGESCGLESSLFCKKSPFDHLVCQKGKCVAAKLARQINENCGENLSPPVECDISQGLTCNHLARCVKGKQAFEGESCSDTDLCSPPNRCVNFTDSNQKVCLRACTSETDCQHRPGTTFTCFKQGNATSGVCLQSNCVISSDCVYKTDPLFRCSGLNTGGSICVPFPDGTRFLGQTCGIGNVCAPPYICQKILTGDKSAVCLLECRTSTECEKTGFAAPSCSSRTRGGICVARCNKGESCPVGLSCSATEGYCHLPNPP